MPIFLRPDHDESGKNETIIIRIQISLEPSNWIYLEMEMITEFKTQNL